MALNRLEKQLSVALKSCVDSLIHIGDVADSDDDNWEDEGQHQQAVDDGQEALKASQWKDKEVKRG